MKIANLALVLTGVSGVASMVNFGPVSTVNRSAPIKMFKIIIFLKLIYLYLLYWLVGVDEEWFFITKGNYLYDLEYFPAAAKAYQKALKETKSPYVYSSLGYCYLYCGITDKALKYLNIAYSKKSTPEFAVGLVYAEYEQGNIQKSKEIFENIKDQTQGDSEKLKEPLEHMEEMFSKETDKN